jgi:hypothetical protein
MKQQRALLTMQDVDSASIPPEDANAIAYPAAEIWRDRSERRVRRYGQSVDALERDPKTKAILAKLEEPVSMSFANETPLEDVLKYVKAASVGPNDSGIPIYVDPVGLQEADRTLRSTVTLDLEGVPLKTTLRLLLKQLGLAYTVGDGLLTITSESSANTPSEVRIYPVADLVLIPSSLIGNRGMGSLGAGGFGGGFSGSGSLGASGFPGGAANSGFRSNPPKASLPN